LSLSARPAEPGDDHATPTSGDDVSRAASLRIVGDSVAVGSWTVVSRVTGFGRAVTIAAVLGPTYLGNTYQATNLLPNLTFYLLTGTLFTTLLVPPLTRRIEVGNQEAAERLVGGFLGMAVAVLGIGALACVVAGPLLLRLLTLGVARPSIAASQMHVGWPLLVMLMPQVVLYGIAGTGAAVMNAHGRFALAAAAPALENLGIVVTLAVSALLFGTGASLESVPSSQLLILGLGTTAAVGAHATAQWWGAHRLGFRLAPRAGWRDPDLRALIRRAVASFGYSGLESFRTFAALIVANSLAGGVVAFQLALNFMYLAVAVGSQPISVAMLPQLSRLYHRRLPEAFRAELVRAVSLMFFLTVPAVVVFIVLSAPLARAVSVGEMAAGNGETLVAASIAAVALGVLGQSIFLACTQAAYARLDAHTPLKGMTTKAATSLLLMVPAALATHGVGTLIVLGLAMATGELTGAWYLAARLGDALVPGDAVLLRAFVRALGASAVMVAPAYLVATSASGILDGAGYGDLGAMLAAGAVGAAIYLAVHRAWRSPELSSYATALRGLGSGPQHPWLRRA
jgi:putative peptidoglycan lipid II flippase